jgi:acetyl-CoA carboxylase carboxyl transferase subunit alpha
MAMKITAQDLLKFGIIDGIIPEPMGGAHRDPEKAIASVGDAIEQSLEAMSGLGADALRAARATKFLAMGARGESKPRALRPVNRS